MSQEVVEEAVLSSHGWRLTHSAQRLKSRNLHGGRHAADVLVKVGAVCGAIALSSQVGRAGLGQRRCAKAMVRSEGKGRKVRREGIKDKVGPQNGFYRSATSNLVTGVPKTKTQSGERGWRHAKRREAKH